MCFWVEYCLIALYFVEKDILHFERFMPLDLTVIKEEVTGFIALLSKWMKILLYSQVWYTLNHTLGHPKQNKQVTDLLL